ncbi:hypothetical protein Fmac_005155 [Flemingia macrophylla]|uniref:non-specific serine/threonine protein kinase n=1 Tax=Flemingia macrophylla TaxID=520843 RepID=A0ABD1N724_9FABA
MAGCAWHFGLQFMITTLIILIIPVANAQPQFFDYPSFNATYVQQLKLEGNASNSGSAIHLTKNSMDPNTNGTVGRVTFSELISLWDNSSNELKDFTTHFSFIVSSNQSIYGDGLAFFLASSDLPSADNKNLRGGGLGVGLVGGNKNLIRTDYQFVAVEFDTYSNGWDPDGAHVGININDMRSKILEKWWINIPRGERISAGSAQALKDYIDEVSIISQLRHRNLVRLTLWFHKKNDLFLLYDYMPNGSLDSSLFGRQKLLSWEVRYNVAMGLASALLYLQEEWEKCVLHRDIKSSNIMLDSNYNPKLGDFGLARQVDHEKGSHTSVVVGTMGYLAPEYMNTGQTGKESDIFSFGVVLLEVATGRKATLTTKTWRLYGFRNLLAAADPKLCDEFNVQQLECLLVVGLWCANPDSASRPTIRQVIEVLKFEAALPILPQQIPCKPSIPV